MIKNRIFYALIEVACLGFSMAYQSNVTAVILITVTAYPVVAAVCTVIQAALFHADFEEKRIIAEKDTLFELFLNVKNRSIFPCVPVELQCVLPDSDTGLFAEKRIFVSLSPLGSARLSINCRHIYRGSYSCRIKKISAFDPLRIIRISIKKKTENVSVFLPRKIELIDIIKTSHGEQSYTRNIISSERDDFSHVRGYRDGDLYQMVHWKLTAKSDEIMIKQYDSLSEQRAMVLCNWGGAGYILLRTDTVIETAIAFVSAMLKEKISCYIDYDDENICKVSDVGEFERFYDMMSVIPIKLQTASFAARINEADLNGLSILVLITAELNDEIISCANAAAEICTVYLSYINLAAKPVSEILYQEKFGFLDIHGAGSDALNVAAQVMKDNSR